MDLNSFISSSTCSLLFKIQLSENFATGYHSLFLFLAFYKVYFLGNILLEVKILLQEIGRGVDEIQDGYTGPVSNLLNHVFSVCPSFSNAFPYLSVRQVHNSPDCFFLPSKQSIQIRNCRITPNQETVL